MLSERLEKMTPLQRAVFALKETQAKLDALERQRNEPIAIVGMACRFPGGVRDPESYWKLLCDGEDAIREVPAERWDKDEFYHPDASTPGKMNTRWGGFLDDVDKFDNHFFGISNREATRIDPQQRMLLELGWESLEDAGIPPARLRGSRTGVFVGIAVSEYGLLTSYDLAFTDAFVSTGAAHCIAANRLSYALDLRGPSMAIDTACSSSLVAVHMACQSIRSGEVEMALAGGVNLVLSPVSTINLTKAGFSTPDGRVRPFDARAAGYVRGDGAGLMVLKRLSAAIRQRDPIYAVIRGSAVNQNGTSNGLTAPRREAQLEVLREAYRRSETDPSLVRYVETQGTGTSLGDVIEAIALGEFLLESRGPEDKCAIGSVKSNIGHTETAAGIASLMKVALALKHRKIPGTLHFEQPNPNIPIESLPLRVPTSLESWPGDVERAVGGVSAFGFGGSNAHAVLEEAALVEFSDGGTSESSGSHSSGELPAPERRLPLLLISARTETALRAHAQQFRDFIQVGQADWANLCYTASCRRDHHDCRLAVVAESPSEAVELLGAYLDGDAPSGLYVGRKPFGEEPELPAELAALLRSLPATSTDAAGDRSVEPEVRSEHASLAQGGRGTDFSAKFAAAYVSGCTIDWHRFAAPAHQVVRIPTYPWQRQRLWIDNDPWFARGKSTQGQAAETEGETAATGPEHEIQSRPDLNTPFVAPRTDLEQRLASDWQEVLRLDRVGVHDNFFELGGDSLQGAMLLNKLQDELGEVVHMILIFKAQTIDALANELRKYYPDTIKRFFPMEPVADAEEERPDHWPETIGEPELEQARRFIVTFTGLRSDASTVKGPKNPRAMFVLSAPRSGSTLLRVMLGGNPRLVATPEMELLPFDTLAARQQAYEGIGSLWLEGSATALMELSGCAGEEARQRMFEYAGSGMTTSEFYRVLQEYAGDRMLVDKTPSYSGRFETLQRAEAMFDEPLYIHLVRHPCAMIRSYLEYRMFEKYAVRFKVATDSPFAPEQMGEIVWILSNQNILRHFESVSESRRHVIQYEELVRRPEATMQRFCAFAGLDYHPDMITPYENQDKKMTRGVTSQSRMQGDQKFLVKHKSIDPAMADAWKKEMTGSFLGQPARELAEMFGYDDIAPPEPATRTPLARMTSPDAALSQHAEATELLSRLDDLSDDEVTSLLKENLSEMLDD